jgi:hypothetical protein
VSGEASYLGCREGFLSAATPSLRSGGMNQLKAEGSQELRPSVCYQRPGRPGLDVGITLRRVLPSCQHLWHSGRSFVGFNDVEDGSEEL